MHPCYMIADEYILTSQDFFLQLVHLLDKVEKYDIGETGINVIKILQ